MKKMQVLAMMALLSVGLMNLGAAMLTDLVTQPQSVLFGYGEGKTASVILDFSTLSFNGFSSAVHDAIHSSELIMNSSQGEQIQFLASDNQTVLDISNFILYIAQAILKASSSNAPSGSPAFYVNVVRSSTSAAVGDPAFYAEVKSSNGSEEEDVAVDVSLETAIVPLAGINMAGTQQQANS